MTLYKTIEVDETDTQVRVEFETEMPGEISIWSVTDPQGSEVTLTAHQIMILTDLCHEEVASL